MALRSIYKDVQEGVNALGLQRTLSQGPQFKEVFNPHGGPSPPDQPDTGLPTGNDPDAPSRPFTTSAMDEWRSRMHKYANVKSVEDAKAVDDYIADYKYRKYNMLIGQAQQAMQTNPKQAGELISKAYQYFTNGQGASVQYDEQSGKFMVVPYHEKSGVSGQPFTFTFDELMQTGRQLTPEMFGYGSEQTKAWSGEHREREMHPLKMEHQKAQTEQALGYAESARASAANTRQQTKESQYDFGQRQASDQAYYDAHKPFIDRLISSESSGNWQAVNKKTNALGRLQFIPARLQDAKRALGIQFTDQEFLNSPELQQKVEAWHFGQIEDSIRRNGLDQYVGQYINGVEITHDGMVAAAHLGGEGGLKQYLESNGRYNPDDGRTRLSDYMQRFGASPEQAAMTALPPASPARRAGAETMEREAELETKQAEAEEATRGTDITRQLDTRWQEIQQETDPVKRQQKLEAMLQEHAVQTDPNGIYKEMIKAEAEIAKASANAARTRDISNEDAGAAVNGYRELLESDPLIQQYADLSADPSLQAFAGGINQPEENKVFLAETAAQVDLFSNALGRGVAPITVLAMLADFFNPETDTNIELVDAAPYGLPGQTVWQHTRPSGETVLIHPSVKGNIDKFVQERIAAQQQKQAEQEQKIATRREGWEKMTDTWSGGNTPGPAIPPPGNQPVNPMGVKGGF